jgi:hypothetical protein
MRSAARQRVAATSARARCLLVIPMLGAAVAACSMAGQPNASLVSARGATIAFESIDGPPQPVFQKLVENLATEAVARQVSVISREATPQYRVRGYLAAHVEGRRTHIGWVWDVYDADKRRMLRIVGDEPGNRRGADAWSVADEQMLRQIARTSIDRLAAFLDGSGAGRPPAPRPTEADDLAVAHAEDAGRAPGVAAAVALADASQAR